MSSWTQQKVIWALVAAGVLVGAGGASFAAFMKPGSKPLTPVANMSFAPYAPQKVVYHVIDSGGSSDRRYKDILGSARNHINAVGADKIDLRFVLQGDGIGLLLDAMSNPELASTIAGLKKSGVRFMICKNTLVGRNIDPFKELYDAHTEDLVAAGVAEVTALQNMGFAYLRL
jgi:intracellular sulfur oxidation DsrE/DsrF family protein